MHRIAPEILKTEQTTAVNARAKDLSAFLYDALTHSNVRGEFRRYLIL